MEASAGLDLLLHVSDPVLIAGADGRICFANEGAQSLAGWSEPMTGHAIASVIRDWAGMIGARSPKAARTFLERLESTPLPVELRLSSWRRRGVAFTGAIIRSLADREASLARLKRQQDEAAAALAEARRAQKRLEDVIEMLPQAVCVFDAEDRYLLWNRRYAELYPEIAGELRPGRPFGDILRLSMASGSLPEKVADQDRWLADRLARHARHASREEQEWRDGRWILHDDRRLENGGAIGMRIDITELKQREASFRLLFQSNPVPMLLFEAGTLRIVDANDAAVRLYGHARESFLPLDLLDLHQHGDRAEAATTFRALTDVYEGRRIWHHRTARGDALDALVFVRASEHQGRPCFLAAIVDVSDRIRAEARIAHIAHHDPLTGLANRIRFREVAESRLDAAPDAAGRRMVLHCIDLDGFKPVNDRHGHSAGDSLLRMVGARLKGALPQGDLVARIGGDEFAVIQTSALGNAAAVAKRLLAALEAPFAVGAAQVRIGASLGYALAPFDGADLDQLMLAADAALYSAKAAGPNAWRAASQQGRAGKDAAPSGALTAQRRRCWLGETPVRRLKKRLQ